MKPFIEVLLGKPVRASLTALLVIALAVATNHFTGSDATVKLPAKLATDILLVWGGLLCALTGVAYSYWKKSRPQEIVELAVKQARPICHCTEIGTVMLVLPQPQSGVAFKLYECPRCKETTLAHKAVTTV
jgi:NO-binding membrane sensor protein with MHYT domain